MKIRLDSLLVIDLEATCWQNNAPNGKPQRWESEIIEIGVAELRRNNMNEYYPASSNSYFVKPTKHTISQYCENLTGISQEFIDKEGTSLNLALHQFNDDYSPKHKTLLAWGNYDKRQILRECKEKNIMNRYLFSDSYINVKNLFAMKYKLSKEMGLGRAMNHAGLTFLGTPHRGIADATNTARLFLEIMK